MKPSRAMSRVGPLRCGRLLMGLVAMLLLAGVPGCRGCLKADPLAEEQQEREEEKRREKPRRDFDVGRLDVQPHDRELAANAIKPGHWVTASQQMRANNFDFQAELESAAVDRNGRLVDVERTAYRMTMSRPASLPKGQVKHFETLYHIPRNFSGEGQTAWLQQRLRAARGGREVEGGMQPTSRMPGYQYFLVVLANEPDRYGYLKRLDSVRPASDSLSLTGDILYYRVLLPRPDRLLPLPSHPLCWTTIAYLVWDDLDPSRLTLDQQQALIDWLHWGGQLLVSGPGSLDRLRGSFLDGYLPAQAGRSLPLEQAAFEQLDEHWSLAVGSTGQKQRLQVVPGKPPVGIELHKDSRADYLPQTGGLIAERRVGGGRIVVTAFSLAERQVVNWPGYDSLFNACLLRRPPRRYLRDQYGAPICRWANQDFDIRDPRLVTTVRYFSRDIALPDDQESAEGEQPGLPWEQERNWEEPLASEVPWQGNPQVEHDPSSSGVLHPDVDDWHFNGYGAWLHSGVAGWNAFSGAAHAVRQALKEAAGISIPRSEFVLRMLAIYLVVLVPLNWGLFRVLGRPEWAWVAAPLIAVVGAVAVVRLAQLDIGFARSRTEIAILEAQGGYDRAHLTRYTALYTSLSTSYDLAFDDPWPLAQPFSAQPSYVRSARDRVKTVHLRRDRQVTLSGYQVDSNTTGMLHCEQMLPLEGTFQWLGQAGQDGRLQNTSELTLQEVGVMRKTASGGIEAAWVGRLAPHSSAPLTFVPLPDDRAWPVQWEASPTMGFQQAGAGMVRLGGLAELASSRLRLNPGDMRLVGWTDQQLPGTTIRPEASQSLFRTLVLVHLRRGPLPAPVPDRNARADVAEPDSVEQDL